MNIIRVALAIGLAVTCTAVRAATYDLASDWSDSTNPNGPWAYGLFNGTTFSAFPLHVPSYINVGPAAFTASQPAWTSCAGTGNNGCPQGLAKSIGVPVNAIDFPAGRVGGHTPVTGWLAVQWTAPASGTVDISGDTWMWEDVGRSLITTVMFDGQQLFSPVVIPTQASGNNSSTPLTFAQAASSAGVLPSVLQNISVHAGDTITWIAAKAPGSVEWFAGVDMTLVLHPVPEPATLSTLLLGLALLTAFWQGRRVANRPRA